MSNKCLSGSVSEDFPLYHSDLIPIYHAHKLPEHKKNVSDVRTTVSNEHPDLFRIKGMKEGGYINPFLNEILKVDREEFFKKIEETGKKIKMIDVIKNSRKYSQDPKYLNLINNDDYNKKKRLIDYKPPEKIKKISNVIFSMDNKNNLNTALRNLNMERKRIISDHLSKSLDKKNLKKIGDNFLINPKDINKVNNLHCSFSVDKSSYISNINNFEFSDNSKGNESYDFTYPRKEIYRLNPLNSKESILHPPPYIFPRWSKFSENYFVLSHTKNGLRKKGGLFSEFVNKNFDKIKVINDDIRRRLNQKREEEKMKRNISNMNSQSYIQNNFNEFNRNPTTTSSLNKSYFSDYKFKKSPLFDKMKKLQLKNRNYKSLLGIEQNI